MQTVEFFENFTEYHTGLTKNGHSYRVYVGIRHDGAHVPFYELPKGARVIQTVKTGINTVKKMLDNCGTHPEVKIIRPVIEES